jgi:hypothetical protein
MHILSYPTTIFFVLISFLAHSELCHIISHLRVILINYINSLSLVFFFTFLTQTHVSLPRDFRPSVLGPNVSGAALFFRIWHAFMFGDMLLLLVISLCAPFSICSASCLFVCFSLSLCLYLSPTPTLLHTNMPPIISK